MYFIYHLSWSNITWQVRFLESCYCASVFSFGHFASCWLYGHKMIDMLQTAAGWCHKFTFHLSVRSPLLQRMKCRCCVILLLHQLKLSTFVSAKNKCPQTCPSPAAAYWTRCRRSGNRDADTDSAIHFAALLTSYYSSRIFLLRNSS